MRGLVAHPAWSPAFDLSAQWAAFLASPPAFERVTLNESAEDAWPAPVTRLFDLMLAFNSEVYASTWNRDCEAEVWDIVTSEGPDPIAGRGGPGVTRDTLRRAIMDVGGAFLPRDPTRYASGLTLASIPECVASYAALTNPPGIPDSSTAADAAKEE